MRDNAILFVYGSGGHKEQMKRLLSLMPVEDSFFRKKIGISEGKCLEGLLHRNFEVRSVRDKYSNLKTCYLFFASLIQYFIVFFKIFLNFNTVAVVSTGPGIALVFSVFFKLLGTKIIYIETWSRFEGGTLTGRFMYKLADKFYVQNKSLMKLYPNSIYSGRL